MNIKTIILMCLITQVLPNNGLVQLKSSLATSDSPLLMKILQSVDAATSDEHLLEVTLKLLRSLCVCMRETLKAKEEKFNIENNSLEPNEPSGTDGKVLDLYRKIYNNTCFNLRQELTNRTHKSLIDEETAFLNHTNCGKEVKNETQNINEASDKVPAITNPISSKLEDILFQALIQTKDYHKYRIKRYNILGKSKLQTKNALQHRIIVILTLHPDVQEITEKSYNVAEEDLNKTLHTKSPIDIDIIDPKHNKKLVENEKIKKLDNFSDCNILSLYKFLAESEQNNLTKVFKVLRKRETIKIYIEVDIGQNHTDYIDVCCNNGTLNPKCSKDFLNNLNEIKNKEMKSKGVHNNYKKTITKIKILVKLYEDKLNDTSDNVNSSGRIHRNQHTKEKTIKPNLELTTKQTNTIADHVYQNENDIQKLVSDTNDPFKLGEVTRAILLLNNFVSKQTTKKVLKLQPTTDKHEEFAGQQENNTTNDTNHSPNQNVLHKLSNNQSRSSLPINKNKITSTEDHLIEKIYNKSAGLPLKKSSHSHMNEVLGVTLPMTLATDGGKDETQEVSNLKLDIENFVNNTFTVDISAKDLAITDLTTGGKQNTTNTYIKLSTMNYMPEYDKKPTKFTFLSTNNVKMSTQSRLTDFKVSDKAMRILDRNITDYTILTSTENTLPTFTNLKNLVKNISLIPTNIDKTEKHLLDQLSTTSDEFKTVKKDLKYKKTNYVPTLTTLKPFFTITIDDKWQKIRKRPNLSNNGKLLKSSASNEKYLRSIYETYRTSSKHHIFQETTSIDQIKLNKATLIPASNNLSTAIHEFEVIPLYNRPAHTVKKNRVAELITTPALRVTIDELDQTLKKTATKENKNDKTEQKDKPNPEIINFMVEDSLDAGNNNKKSSTINKTVLKTSILSFDTTLKPMNTAQDIPIYEADNEIPITKTKDFLSYIIPAITDRPVTEFISMKNIKSMKYYGTLSDSPDIFHNSSYLSSKAPNFEVRGLFDNKYWKSNYLKKSESLVLTESPILSTNKNYFITDIVIPAEQQKQVNPINNNKETYMLSEPTTLFNDHQTSDMPETINIINEPTEANYKKYLLEPGTEKATIVSSIFEITTNNVMFVKENVSTVKYHRPMGEESSSMAQLTNNNSKTVKRPKEGLSGQDVLIVTDLLLNEPIKDEKPNERNTESLPKYEKYAPEYTQNTGSFHSSNNSTKSLFMTTIKSTSPLFTKTNFTPTKRSDSEFLKRNTDIEQIIERPVILTYGNPTQNEYQSITKTSETHTENGSFYVKTSPIKSVQYITPEMSSSTQMKKVFNLNRTATNHSNSTDYMRYSEIIKIESRDDKIVTRQYDKNSTGSTNSQSLTTENELLKNKSYTSDWNKSQKTVTKSDAENNSTPFDVLNDKPHIKDTILSNESFATTPEVKIRNEIETNSYDNNFNISYMNLTRKSNVLYNNEDLTRIATILHKLSGNSLPKSKENNTIQKQNSTMSPMKKITVSVANTTSHGKKSSKMNTTTELSSKAVNNKKVTHVKHISRKPGALTDNLGIDQLKSVYLNNKNATGENLNKSLNMKKLSTTNILKKLYKEVISLKKNNQLNNNSQSKYTSGNNNTVNQFQNAEKFRKNLEKIAKILHAKNGPIMEEKYDNTNKSSNAPSKKNKKLKNVLNDLLKGKKLNNRKRKKLNKKRLKKKLRRFQKSHKNTVQNNTKYITRTMKPHTTKVKEDLTETEYRQLTILPSFVDNKANKTDILIKNNSTQAMLMHEILTTSRNNVAKDARRNFGTSNSDNYSSDQTELISSEFESETMLHNTSTELIMRDITPNNVTPKTSVSQFWGMILDETGEVENSSKGSEDQAKTEDFLIKYNLTTEQPRYLTTIRPNGTDKIKLSNISNINVTIPKSTQMESTFSKNYSQNSNAPRVKEILDTINDIQQSVDQLLLTINDTTMNKGDLYGGPFFPPESSYTDKNTPTSNVTKIISARTLLSKTELKNNTNTITLSMNDLINKTETTHTLQNVFDSVDDLIQDFNDVLTEDTKSFEYITQNVTKKRKQQVNEEKYLNPIEYTTDSKYMKYTVPFTALNASESKLGKNISNSLFMSSTEVITVVPTQNYNLNKNTQTEHTVTTKSTNKEHNVVNMTENVDENPNAIEEISEINLNSINTDKGKLIAPTNSEEQSLQENEQTTENRQILTVKTTTKLIDNILKNHETSLEENTLSIIPSSSAINEDILKHQSEITELTNKIDTVNGSKTERPSSLFPINKSKEVSSFKVLSTSLPNVLSLIVAAAPFPNNDNSTKNFEIAIIEDNRTHQHGQSSNSVTADLTTKPYYYDSKNKSFSIQTTLLRTDILNNDPSKNDAVTIYKIYDTIESTTGTSNKGTSYDKNKAILPSAKSEEIKSFTLQSEKKLPFTVKKYSTDANNEAFEESYLKKLNVSENKLSTVLIEKVTSITNENDLETNQSFSISLKSMKIHKDSNFSKTEEENIKPDFLIITHTTKSPNTILFKNKKTTFPAAEGSNVATDVLVVGDDSVNSILDKESYRENYNDKPSTLNILTSSLGYPKNTLITDEDYSFNVENDLYDDEAVVKKNTINTSATELSSLTTFIQKIHKSEEVTSPYSVVIDVATVSPTDITTEEKSKNKTDNAFKDEILSENETITVLDTQYSTNVIKSPAAEISINNSQEVIISDLLLESQELTSPYSVAVNVATVSPTDITTEEKNKNVAHNAFTEETISENETITVDDTQYSTNVKELPAAEISINNSQEVIMSDFLHKSEEMTSPYYEVVDAATVSPTDIITEDKYKSKTHNKITEETLSENETITIVDRSLHSTNVIELPAADISTNNSQEVIMSDFFHKSEEVISPYSVAVVVAAVAPTDITTEERSKNITDNAFNAETLSENDMITVVDNQYSTNVIELPAADISKNNSKEVIMSDFLHKSEEITSPYYEAVDAATVSPTNITMEEKSKNITDNAFNEETLSENQTITVVDNQFSTNVIELPAAEMSINNSQAVIMSDFLHKSEEVISPYSVAVDVTTVPPTDITTKEKSKNITDNAFNAETLSENDMITVVDNQYSTNVIELPAAEISINNSQEVTLSNFLHKSEEVTSQYSEAVDVATVSPTDIITEEKNKTHNAFTEETLSENETQYSTNVVKLPAAENSINNSQEVIMSDVLHKSAEVTLPHSVAVDGATVSPTDITTEETTKYTTYDTFTEETLSKNETVTIINTQYSVNVTELPAAVISMNNSQEAIMSDVPLESQEVTLIYSVAVDVATVAPTDMTTEEKYKNITVVDNQYSTKVIEVPAAEIHMNNSQEAITSDVLSTTPPTVWISSTTEQIPMADNTQNIETRHTEKTYEDLSQMASTTNYENVTTNKKEVTIISTSKEKREETTSTKEHIKYVFDSTVPLALKKLLTSSDTAHESLENGFTDTPDRGPFTNKVVLDENSIETPREYYFKKINHISKNEQGLVKSLQKSLTTYKGNVSGNDIVINDNQKNTLKPITTNPTSAITYEDKSNQNISSTQAFHAFSSTWIYVDQSITTPITIEYNSTKNLYVEKFGDQLIGEGRTTFDPSFKESYNNQDNGHQNSNNTLNKENLMESKKVTSSVTGFFNTSKEPKMYYNDRDKDMLSMHQIPDLLLVTLDNTDTLTTDDQTTTDRGTFSEIGMLVMPSNTTYVETFKSEMNVNSNDSKTPPSFSTEKVLTEINADSSSITSSSTTQQSNASNFTIKTTETTSPFKVRNVLNASLYLVKHPSSTMHISVEDDIVNSLNKEAFIGTVTEQKIYSKTEPTSHYFDIHNDTTEVIQYKIKHFDVIDETTSKFVPKNATLVKYNEKINVVNMTTTKAKSFLTKVTGDSYSKQTHTFIMDNKEGFYTDLLKSIKSPYTLKPLNTTAKIFILDPNTRENVLNQSVINKNQTIQLHINNDTENNKIRSELDVYNTNVNKNASQNLTLYLPVLKDITSQAATTPSHMLVKIQTDRSKIITNTKESPNTANKTMPIQDTTLRKNIMFKMKTDTSKALKSDKKSQTNENIPDKIKSIYYSRDTIESSNRNTSKILQGNNTSKIKFVVKIHDGVKNISYIHTPELTHLKVTKLKPVNKTDIQELLPVSQDKINKFRSYSTNKSEENYDENFKSLFTDIDGGKFKGEKSVQIFSSRVYRPATAVTKIIKYNTYQPTTKEDLELLNYDNQPLLNTHVHKKGDEKQHDGKPYVENPAVNNSCSVLRTLKNKFSSVKEFMEVLKAANCTKDKQTNYEKHEGNKELHLSQEINQNLHPPAEIKEKTHSIEIDKISNPILEININSPQIGTNGDSPPMIEIKGNPLPMEIKRNVIPVMDVSRHAMEIIKNPHSPIDIRRNSLSMMEIMDPLLIQNNGNALQMEINKNSVQLNEINRNSPSIFERNSNLSPVVDFNRNIDRNSPIMEFKKNQPPVVNIIRHFPLFMEINRNSPPIEINPNGSTIAINKYLRWNPSVIGIGRVSPSMVSTIDMNSPQVMANNINNYRNSLPMVDINSNSPSLLDMNKNSAQISGINNNLPKDDSKSNSPAVDNINGSPNMIGINRNAPSMLEMNRNLPPIIGINSNLPPMVDQNRKPYSMVEINNISPSMIDMSRNSGDVNGNLPQVGDINRDSPKMVNNNGNAQAMADVSINSHAMIDMNKNSPSIVDRNINQPLMAGVENKNSPSMLEMSRNSPSMVDMRVNPPSMFQINRNSPTMVGINRNLSSMIDMNRNSPSMDLDNNSPSMLDRGGNSPLIFNMNRNSPFINTYRNSATVFDINRNSPVVDMSRKSPSLADMSRNSQPLVYMNNNSPTVDMNKNSPSTLNMGGISPSMFDMNRNYSPSMADMTKKFPSMPDTSRNLPLMVEINRNSPSMFDTNGNSPSIFDMNRIYSPSMLDMNRNYPSMADINRNLPSMVNMNKNSPSMIDVNSNSPSIIDMNRNSPSMLDMNRNSPSMADINRNLPAMVGVNRNLPSSGFYRNSPLMVAINRDSASMLDMNSNLPTRVDKNRNSYSMVEMNNNSPVVMDITRNAHTVTDVNGNSPQGGDIYKNSPTIVDINRNPPSITDMKSHSIFNANKSSPFTANTNRNSPIKNERTNDTDNKSFQAVESHQNIPTTIQTHSTNEISRIGHPIIRSNIVKIPKPLKNKKSNILVESREKNLLKKESKNSQATHEINRNLHPIVETNRNLHPIVEIHRNTHPPIEINRNLRFNIVTKNFKRTGSKKGTLLDPFRKTNSYTVKLSPPKPPRKPMKLMKLGTRRKEVMTMNTQDFFSQHRVVTPQNVVRKFTKPNTLFFKPKPIPKFSVLHPKFDSIDKAKRLEHIMRPKPLYMQPTDDAFEEELIKHHRPDTSKWHNNLVHNFPSVGVMKNNARINNVLDRPLWHSTSKPKLKDRMNVMRNFLYTADYSKVTRRPIFNEVLRVPLDSDSSNDNYKPSAFYHRRPDDEDTTTEAVTTWWLDDMYLKVRLPLPINSNPGMVFPRRHFAKMEEVADLGALFIDDLLDYKEMLDRGELPLERATSREKGQPLCMEQFYRLLGVCRIPEVGKDRLELPQIRHSTEESEELVVVACRNYFYPIPVKAADRGRLTPGEIQAQLLHAMVDAAGAPPAPRVGLLTSMNRDQWARAREQLIKDEMNRMNLELISRALCILCLDEAGGDRADTDADTNAMLRAMHGAGTRYHSANRWFDKTVQLIISSDGTVGMCYEHSAAEGVAVVRLAERALARAEVADRPAPPPALLPAPQAMKWNVTTDLQRTIETAARDLDRAISDLDHKVYTYRGYGREFMKSCRTSPDVYIQLALQYAYYKMYGYLVTTYESASLRRFRNGRVDNIRSAHAAALSWAAAMCTAETSPLNDTGDDGQKKVSFNLYGEQKKLELFEEAARKQTSIMEANILGKGIDNHLLGLREAARETLGELPQVFSDATYKQMIEFKLSTSQVATTTDGTFMGYGAVCPDGYGCSYNPKKDSIIFCISSFTSSSVTNTEAFRQSLEEAFDSMKLMFQARKTEN